MAKKQTQKVDEGLAIKEEARRQVNLKVYEQSLKAAFFDRNVNLDTQLNVIEAYANIYRTVASNRVQMIMDVERARQFYAVDVALEQVTEDALSPEIGTDEILEITYPTDKKIEKELQLLEKKLNLDQFLVNITPDLCAYGEYVVKTEIHTGEEDEAEIVTDQNGKEIKKSPKPKGLVALKDVVEQGTIVSLAQNADTMGYLGVDELGRICKFEPADFVKFTLGGQRVRVRLEEQIPYASNPKVKKYLEDLPRYVRVGKSMIHKVIPKFKELELLEKLVPASKLSKLSNVNLVGMTVPGQQDIQKALEATKRIEGLINNKVSVDNRLGEITVESILAVAGRTKVIPMFGDKGNLQKMDYKMDEADDLTGSVNDVRRIIFDSIGVPYELIYKSEDQNKAETLKRYARYLRRLKNIQRSLSEGVRQICCIHLANKGIDFNEDDIHVEFKNRLVEIDNLDKLEHADVTISFLGNFFDFAQKLTEEGSPLRDNVDLNEVTEYINRNLKTIGLDKLLKTVGEGGKKVEVKPIEPLPTDDATEPGPDIDADELPDTGSEDEEEKEDEA